ncbi:hypothetical protein TWF694_006676 [Orbilia ellipsospora]|uniref:C3H1-type domain-containing protein n=1 Tax=Orbilia ellipsospora TaxID=2528407 RepID=A0AAV9XKW2_9PEZI
MPSLRKVCWRFLDGYCPRGRNCIYTHGTLVCKAEYASACGGGRRYCSYGHKRYSIDECEPDLSRWEISVTSRRIPPPPELGELLKDGAEFFIDGDEEVRQRILKALSRERALEHLNLCLNPRFLLQKHAPAINYQDHVRRLLSILSDPLLPLQGATLPYVKKLFELVMERVNGDWWRQIMSKIDEDIEIHPISVGRTMSAVMMIFMTYIRLHVSNHTNPTIMDCIPRLRMQIESLKRKDTGNMLSPALIEAFQVLEKAVATPHSPSQRRAVGPMAELRVTQQKIQHARKSSLQRNIDESGGRLKASEISRHLELVKYLERVQLNVKRGGPVSEIGLVDEDQEREFDHEAYQEELADIPYAPTDFGDEIGETDPYGLFGIRPHKAADRPLVFNHEQGVELFKRWREAAAHPQLLDPEIGERASQLSLESFLNTTLALFDSANPEVRLRFLKDYFLKDPYVARFWECLKVELPTYDKHASYDLTEHVYTTLYIMSHPDVVKLKHFRGVRKDMSVQFACSPDFLYCLTMHLKLNLRKKSDTEGQIEFAIKSIATILDGVFELVDPGNIHLDFRWEARKFIKFGLDLETERFFIEPSIRPTLQRVLLKIKDHAKEIPWQKTMVYCRRRQEDAAHRVAQTERAKEGLRTTDQSLEEGIIRLKIEKKPTCHLEEYLGWRSLGEEGAITKEMLKTKQSKGSEEGERCQTKKNKEEGWDDGEPMVYRTNWLGDQEVIATNSSALTHDSEELKHSEERKETFSFDGRNALDQGRKIDDAKTTTAQLPQRILDEDQELKRVKIEARLQNFTQQREKAFETDGFSANESVWGSISNPTSDSDLGDPQTTHNFSSEQPAQLQRCSSLNIETTAEAYSPRSGSLASVTLETGSVPANVETATHKLYRKDPRPEELRHKTHDVPSVIQGRGCLNYFPISAPPPVYSSQPSIAGGFTTEESYTRHPGQNEVNWAGGTCLEDMLLEEPESPSPHQGSIDSTGMFQYHDIVQEEELAERLRAQLVFNSRLSYIKSTGKLDPTPRIVNGVRMAYTKHPEGTQKGPWYRTQNSIADGKDSGSLGNFHRGLKHPHFEEVAIGSQSYGWPRNRGLPPPRRTSDAEGPARAKDSLPCGHHRGTNRNEFYCNELVNKSTPFCGHPALVECSNQMKH